MIKLTSTTKTGKYANILVYGEAGIGKTTLCATADKPLIVSAEGGLLSLAQYDLPVFTIQTREDCNEVYEWLLMSGESKNYETICIDSLSEIAEVLLSTEKKKTKDARQAYGVMADEMALLVRGFRDLPINVYFSCKQKRIVDEDVGKVSYTPSVPGQTFLQDLPYLFDEVLYMRMGILSTGRKYRYLQTERDLQHEAKDRSGQLDAVEEPNLSKIFKKVLSVRAKSANEDIQELPDKMKQEAAK